MSQVPCRTTLARSALLLAFVQAGLAIHFMPVRSATQQNTGAEASTKTSGEASTKTSGQAAANTSAEASTNTSGQAALNTSAEARTNTSGQAAMNTSAEASTNTSGEAATNTSGKAAILPGELPIDLPAWYTRRPTGKPTGRPTGKPWGSHRLPTGKPWRFWRKSHHPTGRPWGMRPTGKPGRRPQVWVDPWAVAPRRPPSRNAASTGKFLPGGLCEQSDYEFMMSDMELEWDLMDICKGDAISVTEMGDLRVDTQIFDKCMTAYTTLGLGCVACFSQFFASEVDEKCWSCNRDHDPCGDDCMACSAAARTALANCTGIAQAEMAPCWGSYGLGK